MLRFGFAVVLAWMIGGLSFISAEEYTIKVKKSGKGDTTVVTRVEDTTRSESLSLKGQAKSKTIAEGVNYNYTETIEEQAEKAEKPTKLSRTYTKAEAKIDDKITKLPFHNKTVSIE
jgi:hypothetical protein